MATWAAFRLMSVLLDLQVMSQCTWDIGCVIVMQCALVDETHTVLTNVRFKNSNNYQTLSEI